MATVRKAKQGELDTIIKVANASFEPERYKGFDFRQIVPIIYNNPKHDYSNIHFVVEDNNQKPVAVAGNWIRKLQIADDSYKFSFVGTVSTLPKHRGKGYMKLMMNQIHQENKDKQVVFSLLTGRRKRYNYYKYDIVGFRYNFTFDTYTAKHFSKIPSFSLQEFSQDDLDQTYSIYKKSQPIILRNKDDFLLSISGSKIKAYTLHNNGKIVGYCIKQKDKYVEIGLKDTNHTLQLILNLIDIEQQPVTLEINPFNEDLIYILDKICETKSCNEKLGIKIYDLYKFVEMLIKINQQVSKINNINETYQIDDKTIQIKVKGNKIVVKDTKRQPIKTFATYSEFIRFATNVTSLYQTRSRLFPLLFDISDIDLF